MPPVKVRKVGNSLAIILTVPMAQKLRVKEGDQLSAIETPDGLAFSAYDAEFEAQMAVARDIMHEHRDVLRELSKR